MPPPSLSLSAWCWLFLNQWLLSHASGTPYCTNIEDWCPKLPVSAENRHDGFLSKSVRPLGPVVRGDMRMFITTYPICRSPCRFSLLYAHVSVCAPPRRTKHSLKTTLRLLPLPPPCMHTSPIEQPSGGGGGLCRRGGRVQRGQSSPDCPRRSRSERRRRRRRRRPPQANKLQRAHDRLARLVGVLGDRPSRAGRRRRRSGGHGHRQRCCCCRRHRRRRGGGRRWRELEQRGGHDLGRLLGVHG